jgi:DNA-binding response OmpR family regulator
MRILLIEDDPDLAEVVALGLRNESYAVDVAARYTDAEELLRTTGYDVTIPSVGYQLIEPA